MLPPLEKFTHHPYNILPTLAAQLLPHFIPSGQITPSLLQHFAPFGSPTLTSFYLLCTIYPLTLTPFYPPWQPNSYITKPPLNNSPPQTLTPFNPPPRQPNSYIILPPLDKLPPHSYTILPHLAARLLNLFTPSELQSGGGRGNSSKVLPLLPIAAHSYMAISVMGGVNPEKSSHCSPLQPTLT